MWLCAGTVEAVSFTNLNLNSTLNKNIDLVHKKHIMKTAGFKLRFTFHIQCQIP